MPQSKVTKLPQDTLDAIEREAKHLIAARKTDDSIAGLDYDALYASITPEAAVELVRAYRIIQSEDVSKMRSVVEIEVHPDLDQDTCDLVIDFAQALGDKLFFAQEKYGYSNGWMQDDWMPECRKKLREHLEKGDPRDVAAYCAFLFYHSAPTFVASEQAKGHTRQYDWGGELDFDGGDITMTPHDMLDFAAFVLEEAGVAGAEPNEIKAAVERWFNE